MKKLIALFIALLVPCIAVAEQDVFSVEGEWYATLLYGDMCHSATEKGENCFCVSTVYGDEIYRPDGVAECETESITMEYIRFSEDAVLYYDRQDGEIDGILFMRTDGEWKQYFVDLSVMTLFIDGDMIPYQGGDRQRYIVTENMMFITNDESYLRGKIQRFGSDAFALILDADPFTVTFGETTVNYGVPFYLFVSTSIGK